MKIYKYHRRGKPDDFYAHSWSVEELSNHIKIFVKGRGTVKLPKKNITEIDIDVAEEWSYGEIHRLWYAYGKHVTEEYCRNRLPCAEVCIPVYLVIASRCTDAPFLDVIRDKAGFNVYGGAYSFAAFGLFMFPIMEFDDHLIKEHGYDIEKHGSMKDFCADKWGEDFCIRLQNLWSTDENTAELSRDKASC